eukprot:GHRR01014303.1.p1 GENE.GHRR01014303.1~~GHRR01014303.1.p1  ORF type:complete len:205 (+),score=60.85 GHRR01014303.1:295-909(+)
MATQAPRGTFGRLEDSANNIVLPSTLGYRERTRLKQQHGFDYGRMYNCTTSHGMDVFARLTADASVRRTLKTGKGSNSCAAQQFEFKAAADVSYTVERTGTQAVSGFVSNCNTPALTRTMHDLCSSSRTSSPEPVLTTLHPSTIKSYNKKYHMDFMSAARPQARTCNQTLRMLGTYRSDAAIAKALEVHIPGGVVSGFHPDVKC